MPEKSDIPHSIESNTPSVDSSSSKKELLLQNLSFEEAFQGLNPRSLVPYFEQFDTMENLQNFLDMANACVTLAKERHGKPIQNPHGFLFAQLRAGYINPPEGFKSRKVRAQEIRNRQLEEELTALRRLKEHEQELRLTLFEMQLTDEERTHLEHEARQRINPTLGVSVKLQLEAQKAVLLKEWFTRQDTLGVSV